MINTFVHESFAENHHVSIQTWLITCLDFDLVPKLFLLRVNKHGGRQIHTFHGREKGIKIRTLNVKVPYRKFFLVDELNMMYFALFYKVT